jgi:pimeloyl-ACP methyl ester carboxylesterase
MTDRIKRDFLKAGAAAAAIAATPQVFAQQTPAPPAPPATLPGTTKFYQKGRVRIAYQEHGSGFPLLLIAGGGLNSSMSGLVQRAPFNPIAEFSNEYRCIYADLRNANTGQSSGPIEVDRSWDSHADDQLALMDHLGIRKFLVLGFCIGGPFIWNLIKRAPDRVVAGVPAQPVGFRPEAPTVLFDSAITTWMPDFLKRRPDVTQATVEQYLTNMWSKSDFVFTVTRDFVRHCQTPVLIMPDDVPAHPYATAMESALLAPRSEVSMFPWNDPRERIPLAVRQVRSFLRAHRSAA